MRLLLLLFLSLCLLGLAFCLSVLVLKSAKEILQKKQSRFNKWFKSLIEQSQKRFCLLLMPIILCSCCPVSNVQTRIECPPMLREATYKAMQADEVADYRIAVERCKL